MSRYSQAEFLYDFINIFAKYAQRAASPARSQMQEVRNRLEIGVKT